MRSRSPRPCSRSSKPTSSPARRFASTAAGTWRDGQAAAPPPATEDGLEQGRQRHLARAVLRSGIRRRRRPGWHAPARRLFGNGTAALLAAVRADLVGLARPHVFLHAVRYRRSRAAGTDLAADVSRCGDGDQLDRRPGQPLLGRLCRSVFDHAAGARRTIPPGAANPARACIDDALRRELRSRGGALAHLGAGSDAPAVLAMGAGARDRCRHTARLDQTPG